MNIKELKRYIEDQDEMSYPELSALLSILTKEINISRPEMTIEEKWSGIDLRVKIYNMFEDLKKSMSKEEIDQEETAKQARRLDLQMYTEMVKNTSIFDEDEPICC